MGNIRLQRITRIRDKRHTRIRMPLPNKTWKISNARPKLSWFSVRSKPTNDDKVCSSGGVKCDTPTSHKCSVPLALIWKESLSISTTLLSRPTIKLFWFTSPTTCPCSWTVAKMKQYCAQHRVENPTHNEGDSGDDVPGYRSYESVLYQKLLAS